MKRELEQAFWAKVSKGPDECWTWTGRLDPKGYGKIRRAGIELAAHRLSYEIHFGALLPGFGVFHRCDTPACVNPEHLWTGTQAENLADCERKGRARHPRGREQPAAKLTDEQVVELRQLWEIHRVDPYELARRFTVSRAVVRRVIARQAWKHVA